MASVEGMETIVGTCSNIRGQVKDKNLDMDGENGGLLSYHEGSPLSSQLLMSEQYMGR